MLNFFLKKTLFFPFPFRSFLIPHCCCCLLISERTESAKYWQEERKQEKKIFFYLAVFLQQQLCWQFDFDLNRTLKLLDSIKIFVTLNTEHLNFEKKSKKRKKIKKKQQKVEKCISKINVAFVCFAVFLLLFQTVLFSNHQKHHGQHSTKKKHWVFVINIFFYY